MSGASEAAMADWLAALFCAPPVRADIAQWGSEAGVALLEAIATELDCAPAIARMRAALSASVPSVTLALDLSAAYTRLFADPTDPAGAVSPYESHYTGNGRLFDAATSEMATMLRGCGLSVEDDCREPPDHISIELALLAALLRMGDAGGADRVLARLGRWVPAFIAGCRDRDPDGFYGGAASVLDALLRRVNLHVLQDLGTSCRLS